VGDSKTLQELVEVGHVRGGRGPLHLIGIHRGLLCGKPVFRSFERSRGARGRVRGGRMHSVRHPEWREGGTSDEEQMHDGGTVCKTQLVLSAGHCTIRHLSPVS
jgi:hypothetical protein